MYCEICGFEPVYTDEVDEIAEIPKPSILDPDAVIMMCRRCAQATYVNFEDYFEEDEDEDLDPIFIEEMFGLDALEDENDDELD